MRRLGGWMLIGMLLLGAAPWARAQESEPPRYAAPGPYAVGVREFVIEDAERPLEATVWYPARPAEGADKARYRVLFLSIEGGAYPDAAPDLSGGPYPLAIFSHGLGGMRYQSTFLTEHLASQGFVVIAADHPGSTLRDLIAHGADGENLESVRDRPAAFTQIATSFALRPLEVLRELDFAASLTAPGGPLAGVIDTDNAAVIGHSFGGYTTLAVAGARLDFTAFETACRHPMQVTFDPQGDPPLRPSQGTATAEDTMSCLLLRAQDLMASARGLDAPPEGLWPATTDPRIHAAVALAPAGAALFGPTGLAAIQMPLMVQVGSADATTVPEREAYVSYREAGSADKMLVVYRGAGHLLFINDGLLARDANWDTERGHDLINHFTTAFLRAHLLDDPDAAAALAPNAAAFDLVDTLRAP